VGHQRLAPRIIVPRAVFEEVRAGQEKDPTAALALAWAEERCLPDATVPVSVEHWDVGPGESQVIAHGLAGLRWVVLDDLAARRCAMSHGLPVIGSLGVVLRSKQRGLLDHAKPWVTKLVEAGMFMDERLRDLALESIGE